MAGNDCGRPLRPGDRLTVIAPSGVLQERQAFEAGVALWRAQGYEIGLTPGYDQGWGYLAGSDRHRRDQLRRAMTDPSCCGILCARGGYGGTRLLETWRWPQIPSQAPSQAPPQASSEAYPHRPWLIGFSDVTSLLWSAACQEAVYGVHGPLLTTLAQEPEWSAQRLFDWVAGRPIPPLTGQGWGGGTARGRLMPANLTVATHLLNTPHQPDLTGVILALEDVSEAPYRLDRMLTYWRMTGALRTLSGVALGRFSRCDPSGNRPSFTVGEVLRDRLGDLGIPVVSGLPFGHDGPNAALPIGSTAQLDGDRGTLEVLA
ncbi:MAG: LD-carboxypeptidase [Elainellaceae cyanobacterium]